MNKMKRLTALLLALMMILSTFAAAEPAYQLGEMTSDDWQAIVDNAEKELFTIDEGDSGKEVTPERPAQLPHEWYHPYTEGVSAVLAVSDEKLDPLQITASGVAVLNHSTAGQWQINIGGVWVGVTGETGDALWVTAAMMNGMTTADFRKALEPVDEQTGAYTVFTQTATVEIVAELPSTFSLLSRADETGSEAETPAEDTTSDGQLSLQAANPDLDKYIIVIDYAFDTTSTSGGTNAATQYMAEVSTNKQSFSATVKHPIVQGYAPTRYTVSAVNADGSTSTQLPEKFTYSDTNIVIADAKIHGDVTITVYYGPAENKFAVKYWEELVEYTIDSEGNDVKYDEVTVNEVPAATLPREYTGMTEAMVKASYPADYPSYPDETKVQYFASLYTPEGFKPLLYDEEIAIAADGTTEVNVYYQRLYYLMAFNLNGGQGVDPIYTKHGAEIKELGTPTKPGYAFAGWATAEKGDVVYQTSAALLQAIGGKMPTNNSMYYAVWTPATADYQVVYWFEKADSTNSNLKANYSAVHVVTVEDAPTESEVTSDSRADITTLGNAVINGLNEKPKHFVRYTKPATEPNDCDLEWEYEVAGDGSTIVNVYYTRKEYTIRFYYMRSSTNNTDYEVPSDYGLHLGEAEWDRDEYSDYPGILPQYAHMAKYEDRTFTFTQTDWWGNVTGTSTETHRYYYLELTAKYNSDLTNIWPNLPMDYGDESSFHGRTQNSWAIHGDAPYYDMVGNTKTFKGIYTRLDDALIIESTDDDIITENNLATYFVSYWGSNQAEYRYNIYYEVIPGETLPEGAVTRTYNSKTYVFVGENYALSGSNVPGQNAPAYEGVTNVGKNPTTGNGSTSAITNIYFFYDRIKYDLYYYSNGVTSDPVEVYYGAQMGKYNITPTNPPNDYSDFVGWYTTQECIPGTEFDFSKTMPAYNITLYAKWVPHTYSVRVYNTQALADQARALYDPDNGVYPEGTVTHLYHWLKEENRGVSHGKSVSSAYDYKDQNQYDPSTGEHQDPEREGYEFLLWYYYAPDGTMQPFSFPATPITQDTFVFAVWTADALADYTIYYVKQPSDAIKNDPAEYEKYYTDTANWVTDSYEGRGLPGANVTERAKGGDQLYDAYRKDGWFPTLESHSFMLELPEEGKKNVYVFEYVQADNMPYVVHYVTKQDPDNNLGTIEIGGETYYLVAASKNVTENKKAVVTENYAPVSGNYVPDAFQKRLIITAGMEEKDRVIVFYYEKDASRTTLTVNHWLINADGTAVTTAYDSVRRIVDLEFSETLSSLDIPNYAFDSSKTSLTGTGATLNGMDLTISQGAEGIVVDLYYVENTVNINYIPVGPEGLDANKEPLETTAGNVDPSQNTNVGVVTGNPEGSTAAANEGYTFEGWYSDPECTAIVTRDAKINPPKTNSVYTSATYYAKFVENEVTIKYVAVGPQGASNFGSVNPTGEDVKVLTDNATGSTATANDNYHFVGWYADEACNGDVLSDEAHYTPSKVDGMNVAATYYAKFEENEVTINYIAVGPNNAPLTADEKNKIGNVTPESETVKVINGTAQGSTAALLGGPTYKFVGWYDNAACEGDPISTDAKFVPTKTTEQVWPETSTYYAKFDWNVGELTISKAIDDNKGFDLSNVDFTFKVTLDDQSVTGTYGAATFTNGVATVTLKAGESITIPGLVHGVGYTVEEINLQPGFTQSSPVNSAAATGTIQAGSAATAAFINTYSTSELTISKDGMSSSETALFEVTVVMKDGTKELQVMVPSGKSVTITGLQIGSEYTVKELDPWTWRYTSTDSKTGEITKDGSIAEFTNTQNHPYWLDGSDYELNQFGTK